MRTSPRSLARLGPHVSDAGAGTVAMRPALDRRDGAASLYDAHGHRAYRLAHVILADEEAAADAVVDAFRTLCRRRGPRGGSDAQQRMLLLRSVYRTATAARARRPADPGGTGRGALLDAIPTPEREALLLCMHGVSCTELATTERTSATVIAARLERALRHLRDAGAGGPVETERLPPPTVAASEPTSPDYLPPGMVEARDA